MENRKSELQHPCDNKQGQADEIHWQRVVRTQEIKRREREKPEKEKRKKPLKLKGKIFSSLNIMRNLAGNKHMLGTGGEDRKNG